LSALGTLFLQRSGFLGVFFLVPLGFTACVSGRAAAWKAALLAVLFNLLFALGVALFLGRPFAEFLPDLGYFILIAAAFTWLMAPPAAGPRIFRLRAAYRLSLGALAGALAGIGFILGDAAGLGAFVRSQAELLSALAVDSAGGDAVRRSLLEQELSPQRIMGIFNSVLTKGGAAASMAAVLFISRQFSRALAALVRRRGMENGGSLKDFHAPSHLIWVFSLSLGGVLLFRLTGLSLVETLLWNFLTLCALMYLAQGFGILQFFLSRRTPPLRFLLNLGIILAILSPGINMAVLALLTLLGIAEYWAPMRRVQGEHSQ
jgi:hypothetical protein